MAYSSTVPAYHLLVDVSSVSSSLGASVVGGSSVPVGCCSHLSFLWRWGGVDILDQAPVCDFCLEDGKGSDSSRVELVDVSIIFRTGIDSLDNDVQECGNGSGGSPLDLGKLGVQVSCSGEVGLQ